MKSSWKIREPMTARRKRSKCPEDTAEPSDGIMAEDALIVDEADEADPENEDGSGQDIIYETAELDDPDSVPDEIIPALNTGSGSTFPGKRSAIPQKVQRRAEAQLRWPISFRTEQGGSTTPKLCSMR